MIRYTYVSDLHENYNQSLPEIETEFLIIGGDSGNSMPQAIAVAEHYRSKGHHVFAVPGNHEHYNNKRREDGFLFDKEAQFEVDNAPVLFGEGFNVFGCCGWYRVVDEAHWRGYVTDSRYVTAHDVNRACELQAFTLYERLSSSRVPAIVVTHTAPCEETLDPQFEGSLGNVYFWNPYMTKVMRQFKDKIAIWHHGHTHAFCDKQVEGVRVVCNPRGYPGENPGWTPYIIELEI